MKYRHLPFYVQIILKVNCREIYFATFLLRGGTDNPGQTMAANQLLYLLGDNVIYLQSAQLLCAAQLVLPIAPR
jgi:hypothetical protein